MGERRYSFMLSESRHKMKVCGQLYSPATLPQRNTSRLWALEMIWTLGRRVNALALRGIEPHFFETSFARDTRPYITYNAGL
jgi:hypothetical protein